MGYIVTHRFRCKNRGGMYDLVTKKLFIDKEIKNIIWQYEIDKKNSIDLNILSFLLKWEAHKAEMKLLQEYKEENLQYLKDNKTKEGVICTESGLQYKILEEGKGETPNPKDYVSFTLKSSFIDGTIFNEIKKPFNVRTDLVIKGLSEALTRMPLGSKWIIYVPSDLGYGSKKSQ